MDNKILNWGIVGTGNIARRFMKSLAYSNKGKLYALASLTSADTLREEFKDVVVYNDYYALLEDSNVDVVYIANRHKDHFFWTMEALKRKKAVMCEKPATLTYEENYKVVECAKENKTFFMEALKTPFIPLIEDIKEEIANGTIGEIERIETCFAYNFPEYIPGHYLFDADQGGALNDTGSYCISTILEYIQSPVKLMEAKVEFQHGVDANDVVEIVFESGQTARVDVALNEDKPKIGTIYGSLGKIIMEPFYRPEKATILLNDGNSMCLEKKYVHDDFFGEIEEVHECLLHHQIESSKMSHQDSLNLRKLTDQIRDEMQNKR